MLNQRKSLNLGLEKVPSGSLIMQVDFLAGQATFKAHLLNRV